MTQVTCAMGGEICSGSKTQNGRWVSEEWAWNRYIVVYGQTYNGETRWRNCQGRPEDAISRMWAYKTQDSSRSRLRVPCARLERVSRSASCRRLSETRGLTLGCSVCDHRGGREEICDGGEQAGGVA